jgi:hypothetical protein
MLPLFRGMPFSKADLSIRGNLGLSPLVSLVKISPSHLFHRLRQLFRILRPPPFSSVKIGSLGVGKGHAPLFCCLPGLFKLSVELLPNPRSGAMSAFPTPRLLDWHIAFQIESFFRQIR